jgi:methylated-DNA-protein-cysteine methyltransferase-like protein
MRFTSPPNQQAYYAQVWDLVRQIPRGKVTTYGSIAKMLPPPQGVEIEAYAAFGPRRVINAQGKISQRPSGAEKQRTLLEEEGIVFVKDKVDFKKYGWRGPNEPDEPRQETLF